MKSHKLINIKLKLKIQKVKINVVYKQKSGWLVLQPSAFYRWLSTYIFSRTNDYSIGKPPAKKISFSNVMKLGYTVWFETLAIFGPLLMWVRLCIFCGRQSIDHPIL